MGVGVGCGIGAMARLLLFLVGTNGGGVFSV